MKTFVLTPEEMHIVYHQTNNNWANEVGTSFCADKNDLDAEGWFDPWGRPISNDGLVYDNRVSYNGLHKWTASHIDVSLQYRNHIIPITLEIVDMGNKPNKEYYAATKELKTLTFKFKQTGHNAHKANGTLNFFTEKDAKESMEMMKEDIRFYDIKLEK